MLEILVAISDNNIWGTNPWDFGNDAIFGEDSENSLKGGLGVIASREMTATILYMENVGNDTFDWRFTYL